MSTHYSLRLLLLMSEFLPLNVYLSNISMRSAHPFWNIWESRVSALRTSGGMTSQWALVRNFMNSTMSWVGWPVRLMSAVTSSTSISHSDFVCTTFPFLSSTAGSPFYSPVVGVVVVLGDFADVTPSWIQLARHFAILSQISSSCQMWDCSRSEIIRFIDGGGVQPVEDDEPDMADIMESLVLLDGASITNSLE